MARVVESVIADYEDVIRWNIVITKTLDGALRYQELSRKLGRPAPIPSIVIDDELVFDAIPSVEQLRSYLDGKTGSHSK
ncbi:MAG: hypothetical protein KFF50_06255 [Desulfatitalea sp.]|nr:hypothetical protein [Desulfatitalea sp.]